MTVLTLVLAAPIGVLLGLLGGGGSILTVPLLTLGAGMAPREAIAASLFVVGVTSGVAAMAHARAGRVRGRVALLVGAGGMMGAYTGGRLAAYLPARALLLGFAAMMAATAIGMLRGRRARPAGRTLRPAGAAGLGAAVGLVAGTVGAGGGFLIVPALVLGGGLAPEVAIGTSLVVIAMQSLAGLAGHLGHVALDWPPVLAITALATAGALVGGRLAGRIRPASLRRGFGAFVAAMAVVTVLQQLA